MMANLFATRLSISFFTLQHLRFCVCGFCSNLQFVGGFVMPAWDVCDVCVFHTYITLIALPHFAELFLSNTAKKKINPEFISNNLDCS